jgi:hypothetical protein
MNPDLVSMSELPGVKVGDIIRGRLEIAAVADIDPSDSLGLAVLSASYDPSFGNGECHGQADHVKN